MNNECVPVVIACPKPSDEQFEAIIILEALFTVRTQLERAVDVSLPLWIMESEAAKDVASTFLLEVCCGLTKIPSIITESKWIESYTKSHTSLVEIDFTLIIGLNEDIVSNILSRCPKLVRLTISRKYAELIQQAISNNKLENLKELRLTGFVDEDCVHHIASIQESSGVLVKQIYVDTTYQMSDAAMRQLESLIIDGKIENASLLMDDAASHSYSDVARLCNEWRISGGTFKSLYPHFFPVQHPASHLECAICDVLKRYRNTDREFTERGPNEKDNLKIIKSSPVSPKITAVDLDSIQLNLGGFECHFFEFGVNENPLLKWNVNKLFIRTRRYSSTRSLIKCLQHLGAKLSFLGMMQIPSLDVLPVDFGLAGFRGDPACEFHCPTLKSIQFLLADLDCDSFSDYALLRNLNRVCPNIDKIVLQHSPPRPSTCGLLMFFLALERPIKLVCYYEDLRYNLPVELLPLISGISNHVELVEMAFDTADCSQLSESPLGRWISQDNVKAHMRYKVLCSKNNHIHVDSFHVETRLDGLEQSHSYLKSLHQELDEFHDNLLKTLFEFPNEGNIGNYYLQLESAVSKLAELEHEKKLIILDKLELQQKEENDIRLRMCHSEYVLRSNIHGKL